MKKIIKWGLIIFGGLLVLGLVFGSGKSTKDSSQDSGQVEEQQIEEQASENEVIETPTFPEKEDKRQFAILSGKDPETGDAIPEINVWEKAGSGGVDNVAIGNIPYNTKVEVIESKEVEGETFYHIRSAVGKVSILPADFALRKKKMEELPESEWSVPADETFPVEGWVSEVFITE